jgi:hypothetical protein
MTFWVHYLVPPGAARDAGSLPTGEEIIGFAQTVETDTGERTVDFVFAPLDPGHQITTDVDATALLRGHAEEAALARAVDDWVLGLADGAVRVHELLLYRWYEVSSPTHRAAPRALLPWLRAQDPTGEYWAALGATG